MNITNKIWRVLTVFLCFHTTYIVTNTINQKHIVVINASYNNAKWYKKNIDSFLNQDYQNCTMIYIDDLSPDKTGDLVEAYIKEKDTENKIVLIKNEKRIGAMANQYMAIHSCADDDIIVILDGDDWFADNHVLSYINEIYTNQNIWLTYGTFRGYPCNKIYHYLCKPIPQHIIENNTFRENNIALSHLRTFYAELFKKINIEDLMYEKEFLMSCADLAAMIPMVEMARNGHFKNINKVLLIYNKANPINDHKIAGGLQRQMANFIRKRKKYEALENLFNSSNN